MMHAAQPKDNPGYAQDSLKMTASDAQRKELTRPGQYLCQKCETEFEYVEGELKCPSCANTSESLTPLYTEEDPKRDEMLGRDQFSAGD